MPLSTMRADTQSEIPAGHLCENKGKGSTHIWTSRVKPEFDIEISEEPFCEEGPSLSVGKESTCSVGDPSLIPGWGRPAGEGIGYPLQYSGLENFMDCIAAKSQTPLSDFQFHAVKRN